MTKKKLLVIDDEPNIVQLIEGRMGAYGYEVIGASDGLSGLKKAEEENPDAIILDIIMPAMDGFEVCRKLKENEKTKDIPVIILTASGFEDVASNEPEIKAEACLAKPYNADELVNAVHKAVEKHLRK